MLGKKSSAYYFFPGIFWGILIVVLSLLPDSSIPSSLFTFLTFDKLLHWFFYGVLAYLILWGWRKIKDINLFIFNYLLTILLAVFFGIALEYAQENMTTGRFFEWADVLADLIGSVVGAFGFRIVEIYARKR